MMCLANFRPKTLGEVFYEKTVVKAPFGADSISLETGWLAKQALVQLLRAWATLSFW